MTRTTVALCVLTAALLVGCEMPFGTGPGGGGENPSLELTDRIEIEPGLVAELYVPKTVQPADSFEARLRIENQTMRGLGLRTPSACLAYPSVYYASGSRKGERAEMKGTQLLCAAVVTDRDIGAGQAETAVYDLQATLSRAEGTEPAPPGTYRFEICLDWTLEGKEVEEVLEGQFEVAAGNWLPLLQGTNTSNRGSSNPRSPPINQSATTGGAGGVGSSFGVEGFALQ